MARRIFISFAIEDVRYRDLLRGQARNNLSPFEFVDMSAKQPWDNSWKTNCRIRIKGCNGVVALVSNNTYRADGARWEMNCARQEGIPMIGVQIHSTFPGIVPPELADYRVIEWTWAGISAFINGLN